MLYCDNIVEGESDEKYFEREREREISIVVYLILFTKLIDIRLII